MNTSKQVMHANRKVELGRETYEYGIIDGCPRELHLGIKLMAAGLISQNPPRDVERKGILSKKEVEM